MHLQLRAAVSAFIGVGAHGRATSEHEGTEQSLCVAMASWRGRGRVGVEEGESGRVRAHRH